MGIKIQENCLNIEWGEVINILKRVGMTCHTEEIHRKAFENSQIVAFVFDDEKLIGFGRAISDGVYQTAIYDIAVLPEYQGKSIGRTIINSIIERSPKGNFILYASPGKEGFYEKLSFRKMKTGMALFINEDRMKERGFIE